MVAKEGRCSTVAKNYWRFIRLISRPCAWSETGFPIIERQLLTEKQPAAVGLGFAAAGFLPG
jgi:hypothetical protein